MVSSLTAGHMELEPHVGPRDVLIAACRRAAGGGAFPRGLSIDGQDGRRRMRDARGVFAGAVAVDRALARGEEGLPRDAGGIVDPGLLAFRIAAGDFSLLDDGAAGLMQAVVHFVQFALALDLDPEMIEARLFAARRDGEID